MSDISRRTVIKTTSALGAVMLPAGLPVEFCSVEAAKVGEQHAAVIPAATPRTGTAVPHRAPQTTYLFFNMEESAFIETAVSQLIPPDDQWPGALEAGVPNYMDKQLAGAWGAGERLYRGGPWQQGTPSQGYQLPFTPAELFHIALAAINKELAQVGTPFAKMSADQQDAYLRSLEAGGKNLGGVPSEEFFEHLWEATLEGFFSDPVYGGNRDMVAWRMIGFPGAYASYYDLVDQYGITRSRRSRSITSKCTRRSRRGCRKGTTEAMQPDEAHQSAAHGPEHVAAPGEAAEALKNGPIGALFVFAIAACAGRAG
jgi:gluconate 2-dehydrogenase gamma chain